MIDREISYIHQMKRWIMKTIEPEAPKFNTTDLKSMQLRPRA